MRGPLVIGALGGSGTRAVARICEELGAYLGCDLNAAHDNLWFTLLFKRSAWYARATPAQIDEALAILEKALTGRGDLQREERKLVWSAAREMSLRGHDHRRRGWGFWPFLRAQRLLRAQPPGESRFAWWGWKEPNSHIYLEHLARRFPDLRFVFVVRHGLDMAFSRNLAQLYNWGPQFGIEPRSGRLRVPELNLKYWIATTQRALERGPELLGDRFLKLDFDRLCQEPEEVLPDLARLLERRPTEELQQRLRRHLVPPRSMGRYQQHDWKSFDPADVEQVRRAGFWVE